MLVRLHDFYSGAVRKTVICSLEGGKGYTNKSMEFLPDTDYRFTDPIIIGFFKGEIGDVREHWVFTPDAKALLQAHNVPFEIKKCSTCPTAKPQIWFNPFILEEEKDDPIQN